MATKQKTTYVSVVLDESASMDIVRDATISGFNEYVGSLQNEGGKVLLSLLTFNGKRTQTVHHALPIQAVPKLTRDTYKPDSITPLYDAIASAVRDADGAKVDAVLICIMTDGEENASKEYDRQRIFDLIKQKEAAGWTFAYIGANQDAWQVGQSIGVQTGNTLNYDAAQPKQAFAAMGRATSRYMANDSAQVANFFDDESSRRKLR